MESNLNKLCILKKNTNLLQCAVIKSIMFIYLYWVEFKYLKENITINIKHQVIQFTTDLLMLKIFLKKH